MCPFLSYTHLPYAIAAYGTQHPPTAVSDARLLLYQLHNTLLRSSLFCPLSASCTCPFLSCTCLLVCTNPPVAHTAVPTVYTTAACFSQYPPTAVHNNRLYTTPTYCCAQHPPTIARVSFCFRLRRRFSGAASFRLSAVTCSFNRTRWTSRWERQIVLSSPSSPATSR